MENLLPAASVKTRLNADSMLSSAVDEAYRLIYKFNYTAEQL